MLGCRHYTYFRPMADGEVDITIDPPPMLKTLADRVDRWLSENGNDKRNKQAAGKEPSGKAVSNKGGTATTRGASIRGSSKQTS